MKKRRRKNIDQFPRRKKKKKLLLAGSESCNYRDCGSKEVSSTSSKAEGWVKSEIRCIILDLMQLENLILHVYYFLF